MPPCPFNAFIPPYPIRVDAFRTPRVKDSMSIPDLYLLTHTHSDHLAGLQARSFAGVVICSKDAKEMLLNWESKDDRINFDKKIIGSRKRGYEHLKVEPVWEGDRLNWERSRDLLRAIPLNEPTTLDLNPTLTVTITAIDANHCPGAVMYLVQGPQGAVLHTGDVRSEPAMIEALKRNPHLQRYIVPEISYESNLDSPLETLEAIYLDTASLLGTCEVPAKDVATAGLTRLMSFYPPETRFFINTWTWGYENILKAVARAFGSKIHVDCYKYEIYSRLSDPFLKSILTIDPTSTRFHACERFNRCEQVDFDRFSQAGKSVPTVVYVNPVDMGRTSWDLYIAETMTSMKEGILPANLLVALLRHSTLPELQTLVKLFRPKNVVPNCLYPELRGMDWAAMAAMFEDCLAPGGKERVEREAAKWVEQQTGGLAISDTKAEPEGLLSLLTTSIVPSDVIGPGSMAQGALPTAVLPNHLMDLRPDVQVVNAVGEGAEDLAAKWSESFKGDNERSAGTLHGLGVFLPDHLRHFTNMWARSVKETKSGQGGKPRAQANIRSWRRDDGGSSEEEEERNLEFMTANSSASASPIRQTTTIRSNVASPAGNHSGKHTPTFVTDLKLIPLPASKLLLRPPPSTANRPIELDLVTQRQVLRELPQPTSALPGVAAVEGPAKLKDDLRPSKKLGDATWAEHWKRKYDSVARLEKRSIDASNKWPMSVISVQDRSTRVKGIKDLSRSKRTASPERRETKGSDPQGDGSSRDHPIDLELSPVTTRLPADPKPGGALANGTGQSPAHTIVSSRLHEVQRAQKRRRVEQPATSGDLPTSASGKLPSSNTAMEQGSHSKPTKPTSRSLPSAEVPILVEPPGRAIPSSSKKSGAQPATTTPRLPSPAAASTSTKLPERAVQRGPQHILKPSANTKLPTFSTKGFQEPVKNVTAKSAATQGNLQPVALPDKDSNVPRIRPGIGGLDDFNDGLLRSPRKPFRAVTGGASRAPSSKGDDDDEQDQLLNTFDPTPPVKLLPHPVTSPADLSQYPIASFSVSRKRPNQDPVSPKKGKRQKVEHTSPPLSGTALYPAFNDAPPELPAHRPDNLPPGLDSIFADDPQSSVVPSSLSVERRESNPTPAPALQGLPASISANLARPSAQTIIPETESPPRTLGMSFKDANAFLSSLPQHERGRELRKEMREIMRTCSNSNDPTLAKQMAEKLRRRSSSRLIKSPSERQEKPEAKLLVGDLTKEDTIIYDTDESPMDMTRANELAEMVRNRSVTELHVKCLDSQSLSPSLGT